MLFPIVVLAGEKKIWEIKERRKKKVERRRNEKRREEIERSERGRKGGEKRWGKDKQ